MLYIFFPLGFFLVVIYCVICEFILKKGRYSNATFLTTIALSFTASLGGYCLFTFLLSTPNKNPIAYPSSIVGMFICLAAFIVLLIVYAAKRKARPSLAGVITDVVFALLMLLPFFVSAAMVHELISNAFFRQSCYFRNFF